MLEKSTEKSMDLGRLEQKAFLSLFADGVLDMLFGWVLISFGVSNLVYDYVPWPWNSLMGLLLLFPGLIIYFIVKFKVTQPRMGVVRFSKKRNKRTGLMSIVITLFLIVTVIFTILSWLGAFEEELPPGVNMALVFAVIPLVLMGIPAVILKFYRMFVIGSFFALGMFFTEFLRQQNYMLLHSLANVIAGFPILIMGLIYFVKFMRKYPKIEGDGPGQ